MRTNKKSLASAAQGVQAVLKSSDLMIALRPHMAKARWAEIVGPQVASVTQVEKVQNGTELVVRVKNSVWANELSLLKGDMLRRLNTALGGAVLTDIRFKASGLSKEKAAAGGDVLPDTPSAEELARITLSTATMARVERAAQLVEDEILRERLRASLLKAARRDAWKSERGWHACVLCGTLSPPTDASPLCPLCRVGPANSTATRA